MPLRPQHLRLSNLRPAGYISSHGSSQEPQSRRSSSFRRYANSPLTFYSLPLKPVSLTQHSRLSTPISLGCTRDSFQQKSVTHLAYSAYTPLALKTLLSICKTIHSAHGLVAISVTHRLGRVEIGDESILIAVSASHRQAAWKAGEECLERVKASVEIWKEEWFSDGGMWRSNRDGRAGVPVVNGRDEPADQQERAV